MSASGMVNDQPAVGIHRFIVMRSDVPSAATPTGERELVPGQLPW